MNSSGKVNPTKKDTLPLYQIIITWWWGSALLLKKREEMHSCQSLQSHSRWQSCSSKSHLVSNCIAGEPHASGLRNTRHRHHALCDLCGWLHFAPVPLLPKNKIAQKTLTELSLKPCFILLSSLSSSSYVHRSSCLHHVICLPSNCFILERTRTEERQRVKSVVKKQSLMLAVEQRLSNFKVVVLLSLNSILGPHFTHNKTFSFDFGYVEPWHKRADCYFS